MYNGLKFALRINFVYVTQYNLLLNIMEQKCIQHLVLLRIPAC
jgi:hypothetical protein